MIIRIVELFAAVDFDTSKVFDSSRTDVEKLLVARKIFWTYMTLNDYALSSEELTEKVQFFFDTQQLLNTIEKTDSQEELWRIGNELAAKLDSLKNM